MISSYPDADKATLDKLLADYTSEQFIKYRWKFIFATYMMYRSNMDFKWCFEYADISLDANEDWEFDGPIYSADEDMSCWSD